MSFPTVVFAILSAFAMFYWLLVILGAADMDALDGLAGKVGGSADAALDSALDSAVDAMAGAGKAGTSAFGEALAALGLTKVPVTISATLFGLLGFFLSATTHSLLDPIIGSVLSALAATVVATVGAGAITTVAVRPLRGLFADSSTKKEGGDTLVGRSVVITIDADQKSGQARTDDEGIVSVRTTGAVLVKGTEVVIMDRSADGVFIVEATKDLMASTAEAFEKLQQQQQPEQHTTEKGQ